MKKETEKKIIMELLKKIDDRIPLGADWIYIEKDIKQALATQRKQVQKRCLEALEEVIEEEYGEGKGVTRRIINVLRNLKLIKS